MRRQIFLLSRRSRFAREFLATIRPHHNRLDFIDYWQDNRADTKAKPASARDTKPTIFEQDRPEVGLEIAEFAGSRVNHIGDLSTRKRWASYIAVSWTPRNARTDKTYPRIKDPQLKIIRYHAAAYHCSRCAFRFRRTDSTSGCVIEHRLGSWTESALSRFLNDVDRCPGARGCVLESSCFELTIFRAGPLIFMAPISISMTVL